LELEDVKLGIEGQMIDGDLKNYYPVCLIGVMGCEESVLFESFKFLDSQTCQSTIYPSWVMIVGSLFKRGKMSLISKYSSLNWTIYNFFKIKFEMSSNSVCS